MNFVVGVGLLEPQTANGSESFLTPSLSCCNPPASTPGPTQGTRFYCLRQGPCWAPIRQSKDPPTKDRRGGSLLRGSALNFPLALASGCQPDRVGSALLCCTSPQRCDERNPVGDNGQGFNDGGCFRCYVLMQEQNITPNILEQCRFDAETSRKNPRHTSVWESQRGREGLLGGRFSTRCSSVAVWAAHEARGGGQPFWEDSRVFIYAGRQPWRSSKPVRIWPSRFTSRSSSRTPDSSEVCKTSTGRERCDAMSQRLQDYNTTHLSQRASNRWGSRIEILNRYELLLPSRLYQPLCHRAMRAAPVM